MNKNPLQDKKEKTAGNPLLQDTYIHVNTLSPNCPDGTRATPVNRFVLLQLVGSAPDSSETGLGAPGQQVSYETPVNQPLIKYTLLHLSLHHANLWRANRSSTYESLLNTSTSLLSAVDSNDNAGGRGSPVPVICCVAMHAHARFHAYARGGACTRLLWPRGIRFDFDRHRTPVTRTRAIAWLSIYTGARLPMCEFGWRTSHPCKKSFNLAKTVDVDACASA